MTSSNNREDAPLLADDAPNDVESDGGDATNGGAPKQEGTRAWLQKAWHWALNNLMIIALGLLLLGGIVALIVYFAVMAKGTSSPEPAPPPEPTATAAPTPKPEPSPKDPTICLTPECVLAASEILENISPRYRDIDPCTNFDQFVCEGWAEKHDLRADQGSSFTGTIMAENSQQILRHLLESPYPIENQRVETHSLAKHKIFDKLHDGYESCMNEAKIKELGSAPLLGVLRKIEELFPALRPHHDPQSFPILKIQGQKELSVQGENQLTKTMAYLSSIGVSALVDFVVGADDKDPDSVIIMLAALRQPGLPSKEYYKDVHTVVQYGKMIGQVLEALLSQAGPHSAGIQSLRDRFSTNSAELVESLVLLESKLAKATPDAEDADDATKYYNPRSLDEVRGLVPQLSISFVIERLAPSGYSPEKLIVGSPSYLKRLSSVLQETSAETLQAYFVWKTVQTYAYRIEDDVLNPLKRFNNELQGKDPESSEERWRTCIKFTDGGLGWILSKFFVEKAFSQEAKEFGDRIVSDIKVQFIKRLNDVDWMTKDVKDLGIEKVHNIVQKIGYPTKSPDVRDSSDLQDYYESLNISSTAYFDNALSFAVFDTKREWSALGKPTNRDEWGMTADTVNAYYNPAGNEIVFPAGIMQAPVFYDPSIPQYLSYGAFGSVSGHELSHAFDSTGRHYDETGNFTDWWDNKTIESFVDKASCFVDQYYNFTVPNPNGVPLHVNGKLTLGENIADAGGLNAAFAAWKEMDVDEPEELLPGLQHFSKEQMFFISYSNWWCGKTRPETAVNLVYRDPHSPTWARILGTMANSRDFKEAFNCPIKEPTCELW